ncbi:unnamed protein product [Clonostachys rosea]|uniref:Sulfatase N-terminal domain-containing protein n=1 Tax=Bionectria ochroleuca TaxID=29856 RepID=A0ABY6U1V6_BIOOC|nr:unnamed protein product [Clonostachys rosea]
MLPMSRFFPQRLASSVCSRLANRRFAFTLTALAVLVAKFVHIHSHLSALSTQQLLLWTYSFFAQDLGLLIFIRLLLDHWVAQASKGSRFAIATLTNTLIAYNVFLGLVATTFYVVSGSEIRWRNVAVASDASSRALVLTGTVTFVIIIGLNLGCSWLLQDACYGLFGIFADVVNACFCFVARLLARVFCCRSRAYSKIPQQDVEYYRRSSFDLSDSDSESGLSSSVNSGILSPPHAFFRLLSRWLERANIRASPTAVQFVCKVIVYILASILLAGLIITSILRPVDGSLTFLSWTTGLLPFIDFSSSSPTLEKLQTHYGTGIQHKWDNITALAEPIPLTWLPEGDPPVGFEDWYKHLDHYNAAADPMKIDNLDQPLLPELRDKLKDINIRHVIVFFLESTRNDVFPIKKDGLIWNRLADTWPDKKLPKHVQDKLATLTPTANFITGDFDDGFDHPKGSQKGRGGLHFTKAVTAGTYTLKSLPATLCGIPPLIADFNLDYQHHVYQPCLPHIFEAMNRLEQSDDAKDPYAKSKWQSYFYQTATLQFNQFDKLMAKIGFPKENTIDSEYLRSKAATHGRVPNPNTNYFGFEEEPLMDYIRDAFKSAKDNDERVFLSHITSTTHHPFVLPDETKYVPLSNGLDELSHYINAQGYDDQWAQKVLDLLEEQGVANETLVIFTGDHGTSLAENDIASAYYDPNVGVDHVPLVLSHPQLPAFSVNDAVSSVQVLPTVLDLLLETGSLNKQSRRAIRDLIANYEGQSMIRPQKTISEKTGQGNWQITIVNPGRALLSVRDARYPDRHLVVPVINNVEWRFTNIVEDPREQHSVQGFDFPTFLVSVEERHGVEVAKWIEEGAFIVRFFVEENNKRWRYGPYAV